jgi:hypothetical protein
VNDVPTRSGDGGRKPNGGAWLQWVNTVLLIAVSSLLALMWTSMADRVKTVETRQENVTRIERLEDRVRQHGEELSGLKAVDRIDRNREDIERNRRR